jgi:uncharacterized membrane protein (DUF2068 family)
MAKLKNPQHAGLRLIAVIKLVKAALLIAVGLGSLRLIDDDLSEFARRWAKHLNIDTENHAAHWVITWAASVPPDKIRHFGYIALLFALDQIVEGVGLWYNRPWAKYLLLVATSIGLLWESYKSIQEPATIHYVGVGFAIGILLYLWWMIRIDRRKPGAAPDIISG